MNLCRSRLWIAAIALPIAACQGGTATSPGTFNPGISSNGSISGTLSAYGGGPLAGATVLFASVVTTTDSAGRFTLSGVPTTGTGAVTFNANGFLFRSVPIELAASRSGLTIDAIRDAAPFSLPFYRAFVRNNFESSAMQPIARWTVAPSFYLKTAVEGSDEIVPDAMVLAMRQVIANTVPELSGGRFQMAAFESGPDARPAADGWVNITFYTELGTAFGRATVGGNRGTIDLRFGIVSSPTTNPYNCSSPEVGILDHEITHTMGFWHTPDVFVDSFSGEGCPGSGRPEHVRYHAALAYSRPVGNRDPDVDPIESARPMSRAPRPVVECRWQ